MSAAFAVRRATPVLLVDAIAPCLPFWTERLGFTLQAEVPGPDGQPQFAILVRDAMELMYQTWASVEAEAPQAVSGPRGHAVALFLEVSDLDAVDERLDGLPRVVERHSTFYGMDEFTVREPGGTIITFAMPTPE
jgi:catechol 2,3-dioxygenase-like lactoylglutathione lyase family enzyme